MRNVDSNWYVQRCPMAARIQEFVFNSKFWIPSKNILIHKITNYINKILHKYNINSLFYKSQKMFTITNDYYDIQIHFYIFN